MWRGSTARGVQEPRSPGAGRQGRCGCPTGRARGAGARRPGLDPRSALLANPLASRGPASQSRGGASSRGPRGLSPARWPQRRPSSSISQPRPQLRAPRRRMQGYRHHRHRRRLRASREPRRAGGAEAPSRSRGGRRPLRRTLRPGAQPALCALTASRSSSCPGRLRRRPTSVLRARATGPRLADRPFRESGSLG